MSDSIFENEYRKEKLMRAIVIPTKLDDVGDAVKALHRALELLGLRVEPEEKRSGKFGKYTKALVQTLQKNLGLPRQDGNVDQETAVALNRLVAEAELIEALSKDGDLAKALGKDGDLARALSGDGDLTKALGKDGDLVKAFGKVEDLTKALGKDGDLAKALGKDGDLIRALGGDGDLTKALGKDGDLVKAFGKVEDLTKALGKDGDLTKALGKDGDLTTALGKEGDLYKLVDGIGTDQGLVRGKVYLTTGKPLSGCVVRAFHKADKGKIDLGRDTTDRDGNYGIRYTPPRNSKSIHLVVVAVGDAGQLLCTPAARENASLQEVLDLTVPIDAEPEDKRWIEGRVLLEDGREASDLTLRLYRRVFGGREERLNQASADEHGNYALSYNPGTSAASLEIRAVSDPAGGNEKEIPLSKPLNDLPERAVINLVAPGQLKRLVAEYHRLKESLAEHIQDMAKLADAEESENRQDITVLNRATGWDARLIAMASITEKLVADTDVKKAGLLPEPLYGLLRAGLPSDKLLLAQVEPDIVDMALKKVRDAGIIEISDDDIADFKKNFEGFANKIRLAVHAPGSNSTYTELLQQCKLTPEAEGKFASVYLTYGDNGEKLWNEARKAGLDGAQIGKLQLQGKLAFLAGNSREMTERLLDKVKKPADLAENGFHDSSEWKKEIFEAAGIPEDHQGNLEKADREKLEKMIPPAYTGKDVETRLDAYAEDMARKIRLSYPTHVIRRLMDKDERFKLPKGNDATVKLLSNAIKKGFRLGKTPVSTFLNQTSDLKNKGLSDPGYHDASEQLKMLQRLYQITPSNEAMPVLMKLGMKSAFDVMAYPEGQFISLYKAKYSEVHKKPAPTGEPELISRKAKQVSSVTYNLFAIAKKVDSETSVSAISGTPEQYAEAKSRLKGVLKDIIKDYPTMESLFGSMDYCECEHCRSVLSPAAYLVDLLQFVDTEPGVWANFLEDWRKNHDGHDYPHTGAAGEAMKPYDVLIKRRPDLSHIMLTCENTQTAMPYIDIVNEILEYYVAYGELTDDTACDTGDATSEELLAEPQNIIPKAYDELLKAKYPLNLPFDLWLETVRKLGDYFETPLHRVLEVFRPDEDLSAPIKNPTNLGNATLSVTNDDAAKFSVDMLCTYSAVGSNVPSEEVKRISAIGVPESGDPGRTTITFEGVWATAPAAGDLLVSRPPDSRAAIFMESLGLSPAEAEIFLNPDPLAAWYELYGFASEAEATTETYDPTTRQRIDLNSAKALSRRLGVTYKELAEIVQTKFVNPDLARIVLLYKLNVRVRDAKFYRDRKGFYDANKGLLDADRDNLQDAEKEKYDNLAEKLPDGETTGWQALKEVAAFEQRLSDLATSFDPPLDVNELQTRIQAIPFDRILILADPDTGCNFDQTTLQYCDGKKADYIGFLRINLFVRLWRRLGWSIEETDRALTTFIPRSVPFDAAAENLKKQPLKTALIYLAHLKTLDEKLKIGKQSRQKLLTLWSPIATTGKNPLYAQLFLNRNILKTSPAFDNPFGEYLADTTIKLKDYLPALQGALGLTADEVGRILSDADMSADTAELTLANVSLLYRYGLLAGALKLSVRELIILKQLSGFDPFRLLYADTLAILDHDYPFTQTLEFVKIAEEIKDSGLKIEDLDYLLRHRFDPTGKYRQNREGILILLKQLSDGVRSIRADHALPDDPAALSEEVLRQKLGLALTPEVVDRFMAMVNTTAEFTAVKKGVDKADHLSPEKFASEKRIREVSYIEDPDKQQKLTIRGVLFEPAKTAIINKFDGVLTAPQKQVLAELLDSLGKLSQELARELFDNHLKKQKLRLDDEAGFLDKGDFETLFAPLKPLKEILSTDGEDEVDFKRSENEKIEKQNQDELQKRRYLIGQAFLPFLRQRLIRQFIVETMTAQTGADPALLGSLVGDDRLLAVPNSLADAIAATVDRGLDATFWTSPEATTGRLPTVRSPDADTGAKDDAGKLLKPDGTGSALFEAYLEVPATGAYRFYIELGKPDATVSLRFDHLRDPVYQADKANDANAGKFDHYLELKAGLLYRFSLEVKHLNGGDARMLVQGETLPRGPLSQLALYPAAAIEAAERGMILLSKALQLVQSPGLSEREIRYLLTHADRFDDLSLSELPTAATGDSLPEKSAATQRFGRFRRLAAYARLKRDLAGGTDDLIGIFEANGTTAADRLEKQVYPLIARLTRREEATVRAGAEALFKAPEVPSFESEKPLWRLWKALEVVERFGVPPVLLVGMKDIVKSATPDIRRHDLARDLKEAVKARFERETWQRVAQPIFDKLRQRRRDALVSHVIQQMRGKPETSHIDTQEKLYEYFLVDPGMEPVVQTSRIRLAIASLQLFIQRCLLNMEPKVHPSTIIARQWEWMKRYRVWEANRKIFLFPENWLEPEFRDDKTHLFSELEGALLQGDVSGDLVEDAFLNYLRRLDEMARLDICAMHIENNSDPALRILHVFGRTYSQPHKYFYRRFAHQMWTPWEPVSAEIEGDHLAPVVWRDRLYLFWVTFLEKTQQPVGDTNVPDPTQGVTIASVKKDVEAHLHWSEYMKGEWTTRESSEMKDPSPVVATGLSEFDPKSVFIHVSKEYADGEERGVYIHLYQTYSSGTAMASTNWNVARTGSFVYTGESYGPNAVMRSNDMGAVAGTGYYGGVVAGIVTYSSSFAASPFNGAFYLAGRNCTPEASAYKAKPDNPFTSANTEYVNRYRGTSPLKVSFKEWITTEPGKTPPAANPNVLKKGSDYTLLPCNNKLDEIGVSKEAYAGANDPDAVEAAIEKGLGEIATLMKPVFYQDSRHSFFIEPDITERTIEEWQEWITRTPAPEPDWKQQDWWDKVVVIAEIPKKGPVAAPGGPGGVPIDAGSIISPVKDRDWLINPGSAIKFGDTLIGPTGNPGIEIRAGADAATYPGRVNANPGSDLPGGGIIVLKDAQAFARSGLQGIGGGLNVVGGTGFNSALEKNFTDLNRSGFGARATGTGQMER
jgi:hypothetical protein